MTDLRLAVRDVTRMLESTHTRLARLDHADGGVKLGKYTFTREALYSQRGVLNRLGVTVGGQTIGANTDWSQPIALPGGFIFPDTLATPQAGNPQLVGTGMRIYGTYRAVTGSMEQFIQGNTTEGGITLAGAGSMWLSEGVERGALSLGAFFIVRIRTRCRSAPRLPDDSGPAWRGERG